MGSTADKLNYLLETKNAQKNYLIDKGASIDDNTPFRDYLSAFDSISGGSTPDGEIGKPYIDTSKMTSFQNFFMNGVNIDVLYKIDTSNGKIFNAMFSSAPFTEIPPLNTSKGQSFGGMFQSCFKVVEIPPLDISNGTSFERMFMSCSKLETVSLTTAKSNLSSTTFKDCTALKNITIGEGWAVNIYLHYSNNLTVESLHGMIENLADLTGQTAKTFQIGATNLAKIDEEHITMLDNKNWNYS